MDLYIQSILNVHVHYKECIMADGVPGKRTAFCLNASLDVLLLFYYKKKVIFFVKFTSVISTSIWLGTQLYWDSTALHIPAYWFLKGFATSKWESMEPNLISLNIRAHPVASLCNHLLVKNMGSWEVLDPCECLLKGVTFPIL